MNILLEINEALSYPFMQRALMIAVLASVVCAILSCFIVLKGWALMGDAISHAILPGIVVAYVVSIPLIIGAVAAGLLCAVGTGYIKENSRLKEDTIMGILFSGLFALGMLLFSLVDTGKHLTHILLGNVLGTTIAELYQLSIVAGITIFILLIKRKDFTLYCFDSQHAKAIGIPVALLHYTLLILLTLTIVVSLQAVGLILVISLLITPGITALTLCRKFGYLLLVSIIFAVLSAVMGTLISYVIDGATGPCIVLVQSGFFLLAQTYVLMVRYFYSRKARQLSYSITEE